MAFEAGIPSLLKIASASFFTSGSILAYKFADFFFFFSPMVFRYYYYTLLCAQKQYFYKNFLKFF